MTTSVTVEAHHWAVDVTYIKPEEQLFGDAVTTVRVPKDTKQVFYVHSGNDIRIHEVPN